MSGIIGLVVFFIIFVFWVFSLFLPNDNIRTNANMTRKNPNINEIAPGIYLTDFVNSKDYTYLQSVGVRQILTVAKELPRHGEQHFKAMHIKIDDIPSENIKKYFNSSYDFINRGPTLIHCAAGISRSPTIVAAYLMRKYKMTADQAIKHISERRSINPNTGFRDQLAQFQKDLEKELINSD